MNVEEAKGPKVPQKYSHSHELFDSPSISRYTLDNKLSKKGLAAENIEDGMAMMDVLSNHYLAEDASLTEFTDKKRGERLMDLASEINFDMLTGDNIIEKSISAAHLLKIVDGSEQPRGGDSMEEKKKKLKEMQELAQKMKKFGGTKGGISNDFIGNGPLEEEVAKLPHNIQRAMSVMGRINSLSTISLNKSFEYEDDPMGEHYDFTHCGISDISRVDFSKLTPDAMVDFLDDNMSCIRPMDAKPLKRAIFILYDFSGSMSWNEKQALLTAIFMVCGDAIDEGELTLIVAPFIETIAKNMMVVIKTRKQMVKFIKEMRSPTGGGTNVYECIQDAQTMLAKKTIPGVNWQEIDKAEVLVINDGEDHVIPMELPYPVHAISLDAHNPNLKELCVMNGGTYNNIKMM